MNALSLLAARWAGVSQRERRMVLSAATLIVLALIWWLGVAPALSTLRAAENQRRLLDLQLQQMLSLQMQAKALQAQPRISPEEARRLLEASIKPFGATAQMTSAGDRTIITFKGASADALAQWLVQVRLNVRTVPSEARLVRGVNGTWDGTLTLNFK
ncbi:MAG: type II secretion system protein GspM [Rhodoferax sp.]